MAIKSRVFNSVIALLFITIHVAFADPISFDDFLQSMNEALAADDKINWPEEVIGLMKEELYDNKDFGTTSKDELTKILISDLKLRRSFYEKRRRFLKTFITKVLVKDMTYYPEEGSDEDPTKMMFLSKMKIDEVDSFIEQTIVEKKVSLKDEWKILTLKDAFRMAFFYSKYPKELVSIFSEELRDDIKDWLDEVPTWGTRGFEQDAYEQAIQIDDFQRAELHHVYTDYVQLFHSFQKGRLNEAVFSVNQDPYEVSRWTRVKHLSLNPKKPQAVLFVEQTDALMKLHPLSWILLLDGVVIHYTDKVLILGLFMDKELTYEGQVIEICSIVFSTIRSL
ncbi:hypothetical protein Bhyg_15934 [Pseudolycoriella hygida]|uniref:Uncharacterized protein n=1 Tax=Pseudolycoriella hygida TaxID=35572 RepID=A0A9Q0MKW0_9DIPT|nr:hypothetical protein Bhyg_15934 [Pseudolycoriella hygida]